MRLFVPTLIVVALLLNACSVPKLRIPQVYKQTVQQGNVITQEMVEAEGEALEKALREFFDFVGDLPLVSYNAEFDMAFIRAAAQRHSIPVRNNVSCALKMARRAWPDRSSYRLADLARDGNLKTSNAHRALADAERALVVYAAAAARLRSPH